MYDQIKNLIENSSKILIIQADNPDGDSLGSALALEEVLGDLGKDTYLYCAVDMPSYLHFLEGWSRVSNVLPSSFDLSIVVDCSTLTLLEKPMQTPGWQRVENSPCIVFDHHAEVEQKIPFASVMINDTEVSSTGELVYSICKNLSWEINLNAGEAIMSAILGDTQGLMNEHARPSTYEVMSQLLKMGVSRTSLEDRRRQHSKMEQDIYFYKGELIKKTEFLADGQLALVHVTYDEIVEYSPSYNPAALIQFDMLQVEGVKIAVVLKTYDDGKITGSIRCNSGYTIGDKLASSFGGGGHALASGFKLTDNSSLNDVKQKVAIQTKELLNAANL